MGKVIIKFNDNHLESFKCKSKERAERIVGKRPNAKEWNYYEDNKKIPQPRKKVVQIKDLTKEELEIIIKQEGLIND